ncbi:sterol desaturase family protein [Vibrio marisflavi]|nr:sterol desaturase family protein [Vibrio marisflavi]
MSDVELVRITLFFATLTICGIWEAVLTRNSLRRNIKLRWLNNFSLASLNLVIVKIFMPLVVYNAANLAMQLNLGLLNQYRISDGVVLLLSILALDCVIYWQHRLFHRLSFCWPMHRVHHADQDVDISTGVRFHPIEIVLSLGIKASTVIVLGISPGAVIVFEVILSSSAIFTHCNVRLSPNTDRWLRYLIVTPNMHRIHHSTDVKHSNHNFGFFLSIWDRFFGSYIELPIQSYKVGIKEFNNQREVWLDRLLSQPFRKNTSNKS